VGVKGGLGEQLIDGLAAAAPFVIVGGGLIGIYGGALRLYRRTIGSRRDLARRLNQLACGVTTRYVEERFGIPAFSRDFVPAELPSPTKTTVREVVRELVAQGSLSPAPAAGRAASNANGSALPPLRELVYRERHAWLQVMADENDAVYRFSITVTDPRFRFSAKLLTWGQLDVKLGHSRFADVDSRIPPAGQSLRIGAHNHEYAEAYWFGNPGQYQHYAISHNELGTGSFDGLIGQRGGPSFAQSGALAFGGLPVSGEFDPEAPYARRFRGGTTINTLTVLKPAAYRTGLQEPRTRLQPCQGSCA
jgi:hypothetical protein